MTTVTLSLSEKTMAQARQMAAALNRPVEEVLSDLVAAVLPSALDAPPEMQLELTEMAWLDNQALWQVAHSQMAAALQLEMQQLGQKQAEGALSPAELDRLEALRQEYGRVTLLKARAYALLSLRGGQPLLS